MSYHFVFPILFVAEKQSFNYLFFNLKLNRFYDYTIRFFVFVYLEFNDIKEADLVLIFGNIKMVNIAIIVLNGLVYLIITTH